MTTPADDLRGGAEVMPGQVRAVRVLLYVGAGFTLLLVLGVILSGDFSAQVFGALVGSSWPGIVAFFLARGLHRGGRRRFVLVTVVCAFWILGALGQVGRGDPRGLTQLLLPVAIVVLVTRPPARRFFQDDAP